MVHLPVQATVVRGEKQLVFTSGKLVISALWAEKIASPLHHSTLICDTQNGFTRVEV
jgi:hypothetical protein